MGPEEENKQKNLIIWPSEKEITAEGWARMSLVSFF